MPGRIAKLKQQWSIPATGQQVCARQAAPVTDGGAIFLPGRESIGAFDADTGEKIWTHPYADPMDVRTPLLAVYSGTLLVATSGCQSVSDPNGELLALDAATGKVRWRAHTEAPDETLTVDAGVAVVAGQNAGWMASTAFSIATGKQLWERPQTMPAAGVSTRHTALLTSYDTVFRAVGAVAVDLGTGKARWQTTRAWSVRAADYTGRFFLVDETAGALLKVNAASGKVAWTKRGLGGPLAVDRQAQSPADDRRDVTHPVALVGHRRPGPIHPGGLGRAEGGERMTGLTGPVPIASSVTPVLKQESEWTDFRSITRSLFKASRAR